MIKPEKIAALQQQMERLGIQEKDLQESFILGSGSGGQKVNKTHSCVQLHHLKTGLTLKCQKSRSREENRFFARRLLCELYEEQLLGRKSQRTLRAEKIRKQKAKRAKRRQLAP